MAYLGSQESCQVDLRDHLAAAVALLLVSMLMVLHQVPNFDPALQVRGDHGGTGTQAVRAPSVLNHVFCEEQHALVHAMQILVMFIKKVNKSQCLISVYHLCNEGLISVWLVCLLTGLQKNYWPSFCKT